MSKDDIMKKSSKTDWKALEAMNDDDIDYSDIPKLPDAFFEKAKKWHPHSKVTVTVEMDEDLLEWFQAESDDWQNRIQTALRLYAETYKSYQKTRGMTH